MENSEKKKALRVVVSVARLFTSRISEPNKVKLAVFFANIGVCTEEDFFNIVDFLVSDNWEELLVETSAGLSPGCK